MPAGVTGQIIYKNYEENTLVRITYGERGHVMVIGDFSEENEFHNELCYEFHSDQSFMKQPMDQLGAIIAEYGDMEGVKNRR